MRRLATALAVPVLLALALAEAPATANSITTPDRDRARGPLTIAKVQTGHGRAESSTLTITFDKPLRPRTWDREDFVVLDAQGSRDRDSEAWIYVMSNGRNLRAATYYPSIRYFDFDENWVRTVGPRTIKVSVHLPQEIGGHFYRVASFTKRGAACGRPCWDLVPQRGYLVHDHIPPSLHRISAPEWAFGDEVRVAWNFRDSGFSGLRRTTLFAGNGEPGVWRRVTTRRSPGTHSIQRKVAEEGAHMTFRVVAEDFNGNRSHSGVFGPRVAFDEDNAAGGGTFVGLWQEVQDEGAYGGAHRASTTTFDSFTFGGEGNVFCVVLRTLDEAGAGELALDGGGGTTFDVAAGAGRRLFRCELTSAAGEHTAELDVTSGRLSVDGYWVGLTADRLGPGYGDYRSSSRRTVPVDDAPSLAELRRPVSARR